MIHRMPFAGTVQINQVQPFGSGILPAFGHLHGVVAENGLVVVVALTQADTLAASDINCGIKLHFSLL